MEKSKSILIREDASHGVQVLGMKEVDVRKPSELIRCLEKGSVFRTTAATMMNDQSSRSHAVFTVIMEQHLHSSRDTLVAKVRFVDLAQGRPQPLDTAPAAGGGEQLVGTPVSAGVAEGPARVARTIEEANELRPGEVLVCPLTDVGWTPYFSLAAGLVTEIGGMLSHGAVVAREYGLPCVVNLPGVCDRVKTGDYVRLDAERGTLTRLG